ncbi:limonene-1,2-epoxide hydrolase family protein [Actinomycetospora lemnae]|uniref:Limonene-1,2-epoxide hydrolase family protein n=1 Tax=Actinomycetospora lemnae TaxID=3019891 RepID=A0ABT5T242_9PSEU|nr:limonene-1,2-epoxide hydrolase family protein [Actinomycetospora sp. DW7H6]MDD7969176.1 limonene-1,2-epoxide hydrolase family protein [Actinomycetospora sp. DW7H6]
MSSPTEPTAPAAVVRAFLADLERLDLDAACARLSPDVVYENVSLPPARGIGPTRRVLEQLTRRATGFRAENHRLAADGPVVLTERTDTIEIGRLRTSFWVCGTFEVHDGVITLWRDYFDWAAVTGALATGALRALGSLLPGRRP